jgi:hypothetical protein
MSRVKWVASTLVFVLLAISCGVLLPCAERKESPVYRLRSAGNVQQIALAFQRYVESFGKLPAQTIRDKHGNPLYSWRVALLPFLEELSVSRKFKRDEAWDSPDNLALLEPTPHCYGTYRPADPPGTTRYQVFVGPGTAFERPGLGWNDFPDGPEQTLLVVEAGEPVPWSKPADLAYDPNGPLPILGAGFSKPTYFLCHEISRRPAINVGFGDGKVLFLPTDTDESILRAVITRNGGEKVNLIALE